MMRIERALWMLLTGGLVMVMVHLQLCSPKPCPPAAKEKVETKPRQSEQVDTVYAAAKVATSWHQPKLVKSEKQHPSSSAQVLLKSGLLDWSSLVKGWEISGQDSVSNWYLDTVGTEYGNLYIRNQVQNNQIAQQQVEADLQLPVITKTVTIEKPERVELWYSLTAQGSKADPLSGVGGGLMLKLRNGQALEAQVLYGLQGQAIFQATYKRRISLHRQ